MNRRKYFLTLFLVICLIQVTIAEKRVKPKSIEELTNPSSPSYVPYPYPITRSEIIEDLKYAIKKLCTPKKGRYESFTPGNIPITDKIKLNLLEEKPKYEIGKILKVKNRVSGFAEDYYWIVFILNKKDNSIAARIHLLANGLYGGTAAYSTDQEPQYGKTDQDVLKILSNYINRPISKKEIKSNERIFFPSPISDIFMPTWEIKMTDGSNYYYSSFKNMVYRIEKKIPWKKDKKGNRPDWTKLVPHMDFAFDEIDDKIIIFEKLKKNNKDG
ncbi:MAG: hypothetical protein JSV88_16800 [Candidatus Aminicenantes bacterium]|nr:MAG: hypothetical protein JSV88_16800 [Candidatus Aminicenantes bacterium]